MDITRFIESIKKDPLLSPARFSIIIAGNSPNVPNASEEITLNCASVSIPSLNLSTTQDKRYGIGSLQNFADGRELTPITMSFYESNSHKERKYFSDWINSIYDIQTRKFNFFNNIKKQITIIQYDKTDKIIYQCVLADSFPTHVSELNRAYSSQDTVDLMSVSIVYNEIKEIFSPTGI